MVRHNLVQRLIRAYEGKSQQRELPLGIADGADAPAAERRVVKPASKPH